MSRIETLTAYKCKFSYLQRNNPLIEEQREAIKSGLEPEYSFSEFISAYQAYTQNLAIGENTDRAIILYSEKITKREGNEPPKWHIVPSAGKQGKPVTVIRKNTGEKFSFDSDVAALYEYHIFIYEHEDVFYAIFHRQNGSGCKSVFLETANKALKSEGLKLEMDLIVPLSDSIDNVKATKITLQFTKPNISSDIADNLKESKKRYVIRELGLNLEVGENKKIIDIINSLQIGKINRAEAFALIKEELNDAEEYNDAEVRLRVGGKTKKVQWNEFERIMGTHDISNVLHEAYKVSRDFVGELTKLADAYYEEIIESGEVLNA